jgi:sec-independent protein translocase protein TatC
MRQWKIPAIIEILTALRKRLIVIAAAVVIGMAVSWNFSPGLMKFVEKPLSGQTYLTEVKKALYGKVKENWPALHAHFKLNSEPIPSAGARQLNYTTPLEPFFIQCKISMLAGLFLVLPVVFYQVWLLIAPRLGRKAKRFVLPFVSFSTMSFVAGALFFLTIIWPVIINFSLSYEAGGLRSWFNLSAYINFCLRLILVFGLIFELPVISLLLSRLGIVTHGLLARNRKYALLASAIIAAFHADLITMFVIAVPLYAMYEVSVWTVLLFGRKKTVAVSV